MTSMNVSLPEELKEYAESQTRHGYSTPSEYVRELIRADRRRRAQEKLESMLMKGLASGDSDGADAGFWSDLRQEACARLAAHKKKPLR